MRVTINGEEQAQLDPRVERRLVSRRKPQPIEGVVRTVEQTIAAASMSVSIRLAPLAGLGGIILVAPLIATLATDPDMFVLVGLAVAVAAVGLTMAIVFLHTRRMEAMQPSLGPRLARMPPPGTIIIADVTGLSIAGRTRPWSTYAIEAVEIGRIGLTGFLEICSIETLILSGGGGVALDSLAMFRGRALAETAWRNLRPTPEAPARTRLADQLVRPAALSR